MGSNVEWTALNTWASNAFYKITKCPIEWNIKGVLTQPVKDKTALAWWYFSFIFVIFFGGVGSSTFIAARKLLTSSSDDNAPLFAVLFAGEMIFLGLSGRAFALTLYLYKEGMSYGEAGLKSFTSKLEMSKVSKYKS